MTLIGWPGRGDGYCHVERRRSWTWIKLMRQRDRRACPMQHPREPVPEGSTSSTESRLGPGPPPRSRKPGRGDGPPWDGSRRRSTSAGPGPRAGASRPGAHAVGAPGCAGAHINPKGPGARHPDDCTTVQAGGGVKAGCARTRRHLDGSGLQPRPDPVGDAACLTAEAGRLGRPGPRGPDTLSPTGPLTTLGTGGSRRAARRLRMERGGAGGAWREQVHTSRGPIRGPNDYPHHGSDGPALGLGLRVWFAP